MINSKYASLVIFTIVYYIVILILIYRLGVEWIPILWSFPFILFALLFYTNKNNSIVQCNKFALTYIIITIVLLSAALMSKYTNNRVLIMLVSIIVWLVLSLMYYILNK